LTEVITSSSVETLHDGDGDVGTRDLGDHAAAVAGRRPGAPGRVLFDATRGRESNAAHLFDATRGRESNAAHLFDATRGLESNAAVLFDATRGCESNAAVLFDATRGCDIEAPYRFDPTRGRDIEASPLQQDLALWTRAKGLSAASG